MAENKNAKTPADGPEYERGFVDGMQRQMQLHVNRVIREGPTAWQCQCGKAYTVTCISSKPPKKQWVGLTGDEVYECWKTGNVVAAVEAKLKEKNHG